MKKNVQLTLLSIVLAIFSCKETTRKQEIDQAQEAVKEIRQATMEPVVSTHNKEEIIPHKQYEYYFVSARSGLNYRKAPKGDILGKFPLNTLLKVVYYPKISDEIKDNEIVLKGEWLGVERGQDTVYVFDGFLSKRYTRSDLNIFEVNVSYKYKNGEPSLNIGFLNLSDKYFTENYNYDNDDDTRVLAKNMTKDTIQLTSKQRRKFLQKIKLTEQDSIFIYDLDSTLLTTYQVKDFPAIACLSIYEHSDDKPFQEHQYRLGLDMGQKFKGSYNNFTYIGKENPFQLGKLAPIIWKKMNPKEFPKIVDPSNIPDYKKQWIDGNEPGEAFSFSHNNLDYYMQNFMNGDKYDHRYFVVVDSKTKKVIYEDIQIESEGSSPAPLTFENKENQYQEQWTGELFKNKASVVFGFYYHSFGCSSITVLDETEPRIPILCDNRH